MPLVRECAYTPYTNAAAGKGYIRQLASPSIYKQPWANVRRNGFADAHHRELALQEP
ncbi:hypothetical protein MT1_3923 [Pseudomonas sp. MT-1]|nr:hypothetical protein MT1_3923 [Pseudomonas sp. MT-1]